MEIVFEVIAGVLIFGYVIYVVYDFGFNRGENKGRKDMADELIRAKRNR